LMVAAANGMVAAMNEGLRRGAPMLATVRDVVTAPDLAVAD
jgi:hypothetical protein